MSLVLLKGNWAFPKTLRGQTWNFELLFNIGGLAETFATVLFYLWKLMRLKILLSFMMYVIMTLTKYIGWNVYLSHYYTHDRRQNRPIKVISNALDQLVIHCSSKWFQIGIASLWGVFSSQSLIKQLVNQFPIW